MSQLDLEVLKKSPMVYLNHADWKIRLAAAEDMRWAATQTLCGRGLIDGSMRVVAAWIRRKDVVIEDKDLSSLEKNFHNKIITSAVQDRKNYRYSAEEISDYFENSSNFRLRCFVSKLDYFKPTDEQAEKGLTDRGYGLRVIFAKNKNYTPTPHQVERGLSDEVREVVIAFLEREDVYVPPNRIKEMLKSKDRFLLPHVLLRKEYTASPEELEVLIKNQNMDHGYPWCMENIIKRDDLKLNNETYEYGLNHEHQEVRDAFRTKKSLQERVELSEKFIDNSDKASRVIPGAL